MAVVSPGFLLCRDHMYPHGLRTTNSPRLDWADAFVLLRDLFLCDDVGYDYVANLVEHLLATPYQGIVERSWQHPLSEGVYRHIFIFGVQLHHQCPKPIQEVFQRLSLILFYVEKIVRDRRGAWLAMYCSLNNVENWSKELMCPSGRLMNQSNVVPENVLINSLQCMASVPPKIII